MPNLLVFLKFAIVLTDDSGKKNFSIALYLLAFQQKPLHITRLSSFFEFNQNWDFRIILINQSVTLIAIKKLEHRV